MELIKRKIQLKQIINNSPIVFFSYKLSMIKFFIHFTCYECPNTAAN